MKWLHLFNTAGVAALAVLCAAQWRTNRELNLRTEALEKERAELLERQRENESSIKGLTADLDDFRERLSTAAADLASTRKTLRAAEREVDDLTRQRDQLKESVAAWSEAVKARDERLQEANATISNLVDQVKTAVEKHNDIARKYNELVTATNAPSSAPAPEK